MCTYLSQVNMMLGHLANKLIQPSSECHLSEFRSATKLIYLTGVM
jgi:hypothetical protein